MKMIVWRAPSLLSPILRALFREGKETKKKTDQKKPSKK